jgi:dolichyl-phosphate-mannose-protein mannosyltransferase
MSVRDRWWLLGLAWLAAIGLLALWLSQTPNPLLREQLKRWQFWALEAQFVGLLALTAACLPALLRSTGLRRAELAVPAIVSVACFILATWVAPRTNRIYYDEQIYQNVGQNLTDLHLAQMCNDGNVEYGTLQCWRGEYNKQPYGYPYVLSVAFRLAGVHESAAVVVNPLLAALTVWAAYLIAWLLTERADAAGYSAAIAALMPDQLRWAHTTASEPAAALFGAVAIAAALAFVRQRSTATLLWLVFACAFAIQFRPESILILPVVAAIVLVFASDEIARPRFWWAAVVGLALASVHIGHLVAVRGEPWGAGGGDRLSISFLLANLRANGWFYLGDPRFPVVYSLLAIVALLWWKPRRTVLIPAAWFAVFWGIFLFFYAGSYNYGADDRYSVVTYPPLAVLAGMGAGSIADALSQRLSWTARSQLRRLVLAALVVQFLWYVPFVRAIGEEAWGARADVRFAREMVHELPANAIVLTHNPNMFHVWGQSAAQISLAANDPMYVDRMVADRYAGGVFLHWNFWCNVTDPQQHTFCETTLAHFPHTLIREYRERNYRFAIYRLEPRGASR